MNEFSRTQTPSGGWQFRQQQTKWEAPTPVGSTFDQTVILIIKHRLANPAILIKHKLSVDPVTVGNELETFTRLRLGIPMGPMPNPQMPPRRLPEAVEGAVAGVRKLAAGLVLFFEWETSGQDPVAGDVANARAAVCEQCPKNDPAHFTKYFTQPFSNMLRQKLARLHAMNLTTTHDDKLGICAPCLCPLKLKVHTPMDLILKHLRPEAKAELWEKCWITK